MYVTENVIVNVFRNLLSPGVINTRENERINDAINT